MYDCKAWALQLLLIVLQEVKETLLTAVARRPNPTSGHEDFSAFSFRG